MTDEPNHEYAFDVTLVAALRVKAPTYQQALELMREAISANDANLGAWPNGDPILAEVSLAGDEDADLPQPPHLYERDGEEPEICPDCHAVEGEPEWGTVGDGFDGYCPSCADTRENEGKNNEANYEAVTSLLTAAGYEIMHTGGGCESWMKLAKDKESIVLLGSDGGLGYDCDPASNNWCVERMTPEGYSEGATVDLTLADAIARGEVLLSGSKEDAE